MGISTGHEPSQSRKVFVAPDSVLKSSPSIKSLITEPTVAPIAPTTPAATPSPSSPASAPSLTPPTPANVVESKPEPPVTQPTTLNTTPTPNPTPTDATAEKIPFEQNWLRMVETLFATTPTLYASLKNSIPDVEQKIVQLKLRNDRQKEDFMLKKIDALRLLREGDNSLNDIEVILDTQTSTKKYIIDDSDKLDEMKKQNADLEDFLQILSLRVKV